MEKRWNLRKSVVLDVILNYSGLGLVKGETKNVGLDGMLVNIGQVILPLDAKLELAFRLEFNGETRLHQVSGYVAHVSKEGIGVMFDSIDNLAYLALRFLLYGQNQNHVWQRCS